MDILEGLQSYANKFRLLKPFALIILVVSLAAAVIIIIKSHSHQDDLFLIPSLLGLVWALNCLGLLYTFPEIPRKSKKEDRFLLKLKLKLKRLWYWILGLLFIFTSIALLIISIRLMGIWFRDYIG